MARGSRWSSWRTGCGACGHEATRFYTSEAPDKQLRELLELGLHGHGNVGADRFGTMVPCHQTAL